MADTNGAHIEVTPGVCGGRPRIAGHRIRVQDIVVLHEQRGYCADEIVDAYPGLRLSDVYAALTYYHDHRDDIRRHMEEDSKTEQNARAKNPSRLAKKLMERHLDASSLPPR